MAALIRFLDAFLRAGALHEACCGCEENAAIAGNRVPCEKLCCENIFSSLAGDEAAVAALIRTAQHEDATPILVLETMSCLWAIMFVNKVLLASACPK